MRFYSGEDEHGELNHHHIALAEVAAPELGGKEETWSLGRQQLGLNHIAVQWPDRESWLRQLSFLQDNGVEFHTRINHGMTHSAYISDPDGNGIEVLYELPREVWAGDIDGAQNFAERLATEGSEALVDTTENPVFGSTS
jgi:catechol 2,3-dioxygenase